MFNYEKKKKVVRERERIKRFTRYFRNAIKTFLFFYPKQITRNKSAIFLSLFFFFFLTQSIRALVRRSTGTRFNNNINFCFFFFFFGKRIDDVRRLSEEDEENGK